MTKETLGSLPAEQKRGGARFAKHYRKREVLEALRRTFATDHYVKLPALFEPAFFALLANEINALETFRRPRHFMMLNYETPRFMSVVGGRTIRERSPFLTKFYRSSAVRYFISAVAGGLVYQCSHPSEWVVINFLEGLGETHGWHIDDPPFALVILIESPPADAGGLVEFIPNWAEHYKAAGVSPTADVARSVEMLRGCCPIHAVHHQTGDAYLLRADQCLHRVAPLTDSGYRRCVINFAYEAILKPQYGETATVLFDE